jgi:ATP-binding cassette, subfamily B, bacterial
MARRRYEEDDAPKVKLTKDSVFEALKIFSFVKPYKWKVILGMIILTLSSLVFMVFPYMSGLMIDVAQGKSKYDFSLPTLGLALLGILILQGIFAYTRVILFAQVSESSIVDLRNSLYKKMLTLPSSFFEKTRVGELVSRLTSDVDKLYDTFSITLAEFIRQIIVLLSGIIFLAVTTPKLAGIMLLTFPVIVVGAMFFGKQIRKLSKARTDKMAEAGVILNESMSGISAVKAFTNEWYEYQRYSRANNDLVKTALKYASGRALFAVFIIVVLFGALFFIIWEGAMMVGSGSITAGQLVSFVSYTAVIGGAIAGLGTFYTDLVGAVGATERVREILNMDSEADFQAEPPLRDWRSKGQIEFRDLHFSYPTRSDVEVLKGVFLKINTGQKVALVGSSGSGKSTIMQLLLRFHIMDSGNIFLDQKNINEIELRKYRSQFALVPQDILLFGGTIRENIAYGNPNVSETEIISAAVKAYAWDFIDNFPEKLNTIVGERGVKLSGGQRQRIAIARAILRDPAILLLDEATSSLDAESEKIVQKALDELMEGRTSLIIAHRLSTIREADVIYVLDNGKIVESGNHDSLVNIENGIYSSLAKLQFQTMEQENQI